MARKGESATFSLSPGDIEALEAIALDLECTWGEKPNISALLRKIANGSLVVLFAEEGPEYDPRGYELRDAVERVKDALDNLVEAL